MSTNSAVMRLPLPYADVFSIPHEISIPFIRKVELWIDSNGVEWTVSRLKSMKLDFVRLKAGLEPCSEWIAKSNKSRFSGPLGGLQKWCTASPKRRWSKAICFLQMYTLFYSSEVTESQERKFLDGVLAENVPISDHLTDSVCKSVDILSLRKFHMNSPSSLMLRPMSDTKREPHADGRTFPEGQATLECSLSFTRSTRIGWDLCSRFRSIFDIVEEGLELEDDRDGDLCDYPNSVGKIGIIQEAGYKLRAVANPARVYQQALKPLGDLLYGILRELPWDCTHNQSYPFQELKDALSCNRTVFSVDLSGATDYFPLDLQISVLRKIVPIQDYVDLFYILSRAPWRYKNDMIAWKKGQPLGLYPSFASFALTHGLLLYSLNGYKHHGDFYVLGDDVVILDPMLYQNYRDVLNELGCPVSEHKTITSNKLCEFGGKIILPNEVLPQLKWKNPSDDSFLDVVRNLGIRSLKLLRPRQRAVALKVALLPDFLGGLGFNPDGLSLEERLSLFPFIWDEKTSLSFLMSYNRILNNHNYYDHNKFPKYRRISTTIPDLDQRSIALVSRYLPRLVPWYEILGTNLYDVAPDSRLDILHGELRSTTLERYENMLKK